MSTSPGRWPAGYRERPAPPALRHLAVCTWTQVNPEAGAAPVLVLPDGCTDLIWERGRGAFIAGPDTGPAPTALPPGTTMIGIRFRPGAGGPLLGLPLCELRDQRVEFGAIKRGPARRLPGTLEPAAAEPLLLAVTADLSLEGEADAAVMHAARLLRDPRARTDQVASALSLSSRQLRRRWQAAIGYSPKTFQQVLRFRRFVSRLDAASSPGALDLATVAFETGYADQAHLTRECARFAGVSPTALARLRCSLHVVRLGVVRFVVDEFVAGRAVPADLDRGAAGGVARGVRRIGVPGAPVREQPERPGEFGALGGQLVGGPGRALGVQPRDQQSVAFEPLEALGQDVRGDARNQAEQLVEPGRAGQQRLHHQQRPPVADPGQRLGER